MTSTYTDINPTAICLADEYGCGKVFPFKAVAGLCAKCLMINDLNANDQLREKRKVING